MFSALLFVDEPAGKNVYSSQYTFLYKRIPVSETHEGRKCPRIHWSSYCNTLMVNNVITIVTSYCVAVALIASILLYLVDASKGKIIYM